MKKAGLARIAGVLASVAVAVSMTGCQFIGNFLPWNKGGNNDPAATQQQTTAPEVPSVDAPAPVEDAGNVVETPVSQETQFNKSASIKVYKVGSDEIAVYVTGDACEPLMARGSNEGAGWMFLIINDGNDTQINMRTFDANIGSSINGSWESANNGWKESTVASKDAYFTEIFEEGICNKFDLTGTYELRLESNGGLNETGTVAQGNVSEIVETVDEDALSEIRHNVYMNFESPYAAKAPWDGMYMSDEYSDLTGYLEVEVLNGGMLHFTITDKDKVREFYGEESNYEEASYDYGTYTNASCDISRQNGSTSFSFSKSIDNVTIGYSDSDYNSGNYVYGTFKLFSGGWHVKPESYDDSDRYGYLAQSDPEDDTYLKADTDDYVVVYNNKYSLWDSEKSRNCTHKAVLSYDENGILKSERHKYTFPTEEDAKAVYKYYKKDGYYNMDLFKLSGATLYEEKEIYYYSSKSDQLGYGWYLNCSYVYDWCDGEEVNYKYFSKPVTENEFNMTLDDIMYWRSVPQGEHYSFESPDISLYTWISEDSISVNVSDYDYNNTDRMSTSTGSLRVNGRDIKSVCYEEQYDSDSQDYVKFVFIKEYVFDEEQAVVTEYRYRVSDFSDVDVNLDNYQNKTADRVLTYRFDMTKVKQ